jgi:hypothetical protein
VETLTGIIVYYIISDRNASLYASENFDRRVRLRTSGTLLTSFIMAFRSRVIYDVLSYRCNYPKIHSIKIFTYKNIIVCLYVYVSVFAVTNDCHSYEINNVVVFFTICKTLL